MQGNTSSPVRKLRLNDTFLPPVSAAMCRLGGSALLFFFLNIFSQVRFLKAAQTEPVQHQSSTRQGTTTPPGQSQQPDWFSHSNKTHPALHEAVVPPGKDTGQHNRSGRVTKPATDTFANNPKT